jgi:UDP-4-amino-4-deoxy-L-arabinose formyltransferase/UDP-glucuronic acid dehydrogenase (UDP-4-keto-hexauronic acid decarboxylating)
VAGRGLLRIVVVAEESAGVQALEALRTAPESPEIVAVVTATEPDGTRRPLVAAAAARQGLDVVPAWTLRSESFADSIRELDVDLLVNVHSLLVLDSEVVRAPRIGSFNLHPGPLPEYAGLNAPSWAIYEGETTHAVTLHWMDAGIDSGPVAYRASFAIDDADTGLSLTAKCVRHGVPLLLRLLADAARDASSIPALEQDLSLRRYFGREVPNEGGVVWSAPAHKIVSLVRAADYGPFDSPWGIPQARLGERPIGIAKASLTGEAADQPPGTVGRELEDGGLTIAAADEWVAISRMWREGGVVRPSEVCSSGDRLGDGRT